MLKVITSDLKICTPLGERFRNAGVEFELLYLSAPEKQLKDCLAAELGGSADLFVIGESFFVKETVADVLDRQLVYDKKAQIDLIRVPEKEKKLKPPAEFEMEKLLLFPEDFPHSVLDTVTNVQVWANMSEAILFLRPTISTKLYIHWTIT